MMQADDYVAKEGQSKQEDSFNELEAMIDAFKDEDDMGTLARLEKDMA